MKEMSISLVVPCTFDESLPLADPRLQPNGILMQRTRGALPGTVTFRQCEVTDVYCFMEKKSLIHPCFSVPRSEWPPFGFHLGLASEAGVSVVPTAFPPHRASRPLCVATLPGVKKPFTPSAHLILTTTHICAFPTPCPHLCKQALY